MKKSTKIIIAVLVVVALAVGGFLIWFYVVKEDAPSKLQTSDVTKALCVAGDAATPLGGDASGTWDITTDSTLGYRVKEVLAGLDTVGAGRTHDVTGSLVIDGTTVISADFTADMTTVVSGDGRRDAQFRDRIMAVDKFPTATFQLTEPIELGTIPAEGEEITVKATGDLTLRGKTLPVTFDLTAATKCGRIGVLGSTTIVFFDYLIPNPSNGFAETGDDGTLEFVLVFDKAA